MTRDDRVGTEDFDLEDEVAVQDPLLETGVVIDGKYAIQRTLGRGGTGTVYEARHVTIGHRVALKIVNADRAKRPETLARFQREAQICGAIRHPNVGQIYDVGTYDGKPYMVLELHEGHSLADVLDESILPIPAIIEITLQVLSALAAIHTAGVVHRDVKPDNAMLVRALNGDIVVKLVDFGISKLITTDIRERTLTREGSILGSPDYMAPEQLRGQEVDARTDLYAVGVLLYEAVAGRTPFDAENLSDLMAAILRDPVTPPSELRADCPAELDALIMKALSRAPEDRFQDAAGMARQLEQLRSTMRYSPGAGIAQLRDPMPPRSERVTRARRPRKPSEPAAQPVAKPAPPAPRSKRTSLWIAIAIAGVLGTAGALALLNRKVAGGEPRSAAPKATATLTAAVSEPARAQPGLATAQAPAAQVDAATADTAPEDALDNPTKTKRERRAKAEPRSAAPAAEPAAPSIQEQLNAASSAFVLGQMPRAKALYQQILERAPAQPDAWRGLGLVSSRMGQYKDAERAFERYLELRPSAPDAERIREQLGKLR